MSEYKDSLKKVWDIFNEGDDRYSDSMNERILAELISNNAVSIEEREIPNVSAPSESSLFKFKGSPQQEYKYLGEVLLKSAGFNDNELFWEVGIHNRPDIFAKSNSRSVFVECCSCRVSKVISYLSEDNSELWILSLGTLPWQSEPKYREKSRWFVIKRAGNWDKFNKNLDDSLLAQIKKIPDLLNI